MLFVALSTGGAANEKFPDHFEQIAQFLSYAQSSNENTVTLDVDASSSIASSSPR